MNSRFQSFYRVVWIGFGITAALLLLITLWAAVRWHEAVSKPLPIYGLVAPFALTNQDGQATTLENLKGHVWVGDIIFTRCAGPCLKMSRQMKQLQDALSGDTEARLVTLTTDPDYDSPRVLKTYGHRFGADNDRWTFLTGTKAQIANLATGSLKLSALAKPADQQSSPVDLFIHSTIFVVVDKEGQLRGVYESTGDNVQPEQVRTQLLAAVHSLERE